MQCISLSENKQHKHTNTRIISLIARARRARRNVVVLRTRYENLIKITQKHSHHIAFVCVCLCAWRNPEHTHHIALHRIASAQCASNVYVKRSARFRMTVGAMCIVKYFPHLLARLQRAHTQTHRACICVCVRKVADLRAGSYIATATLNAAAAGKDGE